MDLVLDFLLLLTGLFLLWKAGDFSVKYALEFSILFHIKTFVIGFFIFAISTALPEIASAIISSLKKVPELSAGDLVGSSFVNLSLILGITIILAKKITVVKDLKRNLLYTMAVIVGLMSAIFFITETNLFIGIAFIVIYFFSMVTMKKPLLTKAFSEERKEAKKELEKAGATKPIVFLKLMGSLLFLMLSSWLTIQTAIKVAHDLHIDLTTMGSTFIAVGTGLPELSLVIHAVRKKEYSLALGDIFGASLLNISLILGVLIVVNPALSLSFSRLIFPFTLLTLSLVFFRLLRKQAFKRGDGIYFLVVFALYLVAIFFLDILSFI